LAIGTGGAEYILGRAVREISGDVAVAGRAAAGLGVVVAAGAAEEK
jgi:hypothetical protein